ncbi:MAG: serine--tRNA ligase [Patescibacteria group bacterium]|nr:serine--tRNA ligase [Patescibacteria group bacterium]
MLDIKFVRENPDLVQKNCDVRNVKASVAELIKVDQEYLALLREIEMLREGRNKVAASTQGAEDRAVMVEKGKAIKITLSEKEKALETVELERRGLMMRLPNMTHPDAPEGLDDSQNKEIKKWGEVAKLSKPLNHVELGEKLDILDFERGAKVAGAKFYFWKGKGALLEQAITRFVLDYLVKNGFTPLITPDLAKDEILLGTGYQPRGSETQIYSIENTDLSLVGTAEIPIGGYHKDEVLDKTQLPLKYVGLSHCFRTEAGAYGRESYGLYRVHQFAKVEMFVFCTPEQSEAMHLELLKHEENIFQALEIPYRVVDICSGDLGGPAYRKYDLEAWMWGRNDGKGDWGEVTSASNCTDFQARRLNIKTRDEDGSLQHVHTLNGTGSALSRTPIALMENHQQEDGTIKIPKALIPYCGFDLIG